MRINFEIVIRLPEFYFTYTSHYIFSYCLSSKNDIRCIDLETKWFFLSFACENYTIKKIGVTFSSKMADFFDFRRGFMKRENKLSEFADKKTVNIYSKNFRV